MTQKTTNKTIGELEERRRAYENAVAGLLGVVRKNADFAWPPTGSEAADAEPIGAKPSLRYAAYQGIIHAIDDALTRLRCEAKSVVLVLEAMAGAPHEKYMDNEKWAACGKADAKMQKTKKYLSASEVATLFGVSRVQVARWVNSGMITVFRPGGVGQYKFCPDEIERFERENTTRKGGGTI